MHVSSESAEGTLRAEMVRDAAGAEAAAAERGSTLQLVVFSVDGQRYGLPLARVERVLPMVAIAPLPGCPDAVLGAINVHGDVIPVLDVGRRVGLAGREYGPAALLLIARTARRVVALAVDDVAGAVEFAADDVRRSDSVHPGIEHLSGVIAVADGLLLLHDLELFFSFEEERQLAAALEQGQS